LIWDHDPFNIHTPKLGYIQLNIDNFNNFNSEEIMEVEVPS